MLEEAVRNSSSQGQARWTSLLKIGAICGVVVVILLVLLGPLLPAVYSLEYVFRGGFPRSGRVPSPGGAEGGAAGDAPTVPAGRRLRWWPGRPRPSRPRPPRRGRQAEEKASGGGGWRLGAQSRGRSPRGRLRGLPAGDDVPLPFLPARTATGFRPSAASAWAPRSPYSSATAAPRGTSPSRRTRGQGPVGGT